MITRLYYKLPFQRRVCLWVASCGEGFGVTRCVGRAPRLGMAHRTCRLLGLVKKRPLSPQAEAVRRFILAQADD